MTMLDREVLVIMPFDKPFCDLLSEPVLLCDEQGVVIYANPAAQRWSNEPLEGKIFTTLLQVDSSQKAQRFFAAAQAATPQLPTHPWELTLGTTDDYATATFRGYASDGCVAIIGQVESEKVMAMQQEMLELTSELAQAQRDSQRQNRSLQQLLNEQRHLVQTIQELTAPAVPIWDGALLMPLVGHIDGIRAQKITEQLLEQASKNHAQYAILDLSGIALVDTDVAQHLIQTASALHLLGVKAILVGINPGIAETMIHLGIDLQGFLVHSDLRHAVAYVLQRLHHKEERTFGYRNGT